MLNSDNKMTYITIILLAIFFSASIIITYIFLNNNNYKNEVVIQTPHFIEHTKQLKYYLNNSNINENVELEVKKMGEQIYNLEAESSYIEDLNDFAKSLNTLIINLNQEGNTQFKLLDIMQYKNNQIILEIQHLKNLLSENFSFYKTNTNQILTNENLLLNEKELEIDNIVDDSIYEKELIEELEEKDILLLNSLYQRINKLEQLEINLMDKQTDMLNSLNEYEAKILKINEYKENNFYRIVFMLIIFYIFLLFIYMIKKHTRKYRTIL